jgi:O-antigen/teichoic acid export membrane protein
MSHHAEEGQTLRHVSGLAVQRVIEISAGFLFVSLIPRYMGPVPYGAFSVLLNMSLWFALLSGMGAVSMMIRFVPDFLQGNDEEGLRRLLGGMMALRIINGCVGAVVYFLLANWWVGRVDLAAVGALGVAIAVRTAANLPYTLFLGLNRAALWGMAETVRRTLMVPGVWAGYALAGLRGACVAMLCIELAVLLLGLAWGREYFSWARLRIDRPFLKPYLRFSSAFLVSNILLVLFQQGGAPLLHLLTGGFAHAGFYAIAFSVYLTVAQAVWRLISGFGAFFSSLRIRGEEEALAAWVERLLKLLGASAVLAVAAASALAPTLVPLFLGPEFEPVAAQLVLLAFAGLAYGPGAIARILVVAYHRPRVSIIGAALQLVVFVALCTILVPYDANWGASVAALAATSVFAVNGVWSMRSVLRFSLWPWGKVTLLGAACSPVVWLWDAGGFLRFSLFAAAFVGALLATQVVTLREFQELRRRALTMPA